MTSEMVERVARAMVASDSGPEGSYLFDLHWSEFAEGYRKGARSAIEAMRFPTHEMVVAGQGVIVNGQKITVGDAALIYSTMVSALTHP